jgi:transcriptional regulator with XRE-family HTH domain
MITDVEIGRAMRRLRREAGLSMAAIAPSAGLSKHSLLKREQGKTSTTAAELFSLCTGLGVRPACVLEIIVAARRGRDIVPDSPVIKLQRELAEARASAPPLEHPRQELDW